MPTYANSVFLNSPFDADYKPLFRALVFTVAYCGFGARCALEVADSGETRAEKLIRLIRGSRLGIHDISRTQANAAGLPRFNMPYELGLFAGFKYGGDRPQRRKSLLVLDTEPYRYQQFLSDIAGQDIQAHAGLPAQLVRLVRDWLQSQTSRDLEGSERIAREFDDFRDQIPRLLVAMHKTEADLDNYPDYYRLVYNWIRANAGGG